MVLILMRRHGVLLLALAAQAVQFGASLLMIPFLVTRLSGPEVGIWYVFITVQGLAALADFGFQPTVARAFAAAYAGVSTIGKTGLDGGGGRANLVLVRQLLLVARRLYVYLAAAVMVVLATAGSAYIAHIASAEISDIRAILVAWLFFSAAVAIGLYLSWIAPFLIGAGRVGWNYGFLILNRGGPAVAGIAVLLAGGGFVALSIATLAAAICTILGGRLLTHPLRRELPVQAKAPMDRALFAAIWPNASRMGMVSLGAFLATRYNVLIISTFSGLGSAASYAISLQILAGLTAASQLPTQIALPKLVSLRIAGNIAQLRRSFVVRQLFLIATFVTGSIFLVAFGQMLLEAIGSSVRLLPPAPLAALAFVLLLEANHSNCAFLITTGNRVPFLAPALVSGGLIAILSTLMGWLGYLPWGVILAQGAVQLAYNNWKWPLELWRDLRG